MNTWRAEGRSRFKLNRPFIAGSKHPDFVALVAFTEDYVCAPKLISIFYAKRPPALTEAELDHTLTTPTKNQVV